MDRKFSKDLLSVVLSNGIALCGSIVTGFIVPKLLGVEGYGYYKFFTLYLSYAVLMHFGFVDGILLKYAGKEYSELNKERFRTYSKFFLVFETCISVVIITVSFIFIPVKYRLIFILLGIDTAAVNLTSYYQYLSQCTFRFKELSIRKIILAISKIALVIILLTLKVSGLIKSANAIYYIFGLVLIDVFLIIWYIATYKDITFGISDRLTARKNDIIELFKSGIFLTISYQVAHLIFALDRQFVSLLFETKTYSIYSFAYNLISMVTTIVNAVSVVLFPMLKKLDSNRMMKTFPTSMSAIAIVSFGSMIGYQPLSLIIRTWLPDYIDSLQYLKVIFPGLALSCCISIIMFTYFKALDKYFAYFKISCVVLGITTALNAIAYYTFKKPIYISIASILTLFIWYILCEVFFIKKYNVQWKKNLMYIIILMTIFYLSTVMIKNEIVSFCTYAFLYTIITLIFYKQLLHISLRKRSK